MSWLHDKLDPVERHIFRSGLVKVGLFDCPGNHACFPVTESVRNNLFVLATKPVWFRRNTRGFRYVGPGGVLLHPAGASIERQQESSAHDRSYWFAIRPDVYSEIARSHRIDQHLPTDALCPSPAIQLELNVLLRRLRQGAAAALEVEASVISLMDNICAAMGASQPPPGMLHARATTRTRAHRQADAAKSFLDAHIAERLNIDAVAAEVGVSPYHLCRLFKSFNGITLHEYRIRQRLAFVMHRLVDRRRHNLTDLALEAGFSSHSHLTRMFKKRLGVAPSAVRNLTLA